MALELKRFFRLRQQGSQAFRLLSAAAVLAIGVASVCSNVIVHRFYTRWDLTSTGLYTLSPATLATLASLREPVDVTVFLSHGDPLSANVRQLLAAYGGQTHLLRPRFIDPDRDPATFAALHAEYGMVAGKTDDGKVTTDAVIVLAQGKRKWFITPENIVAYNQETGASQPRLEQALTLGLRSLESSEAPHVCLTSGHEELSPDNLGPEGLGAFANELKKNNYDVRAIDLSPPLRKNPLLDCNAVIVAAPERTFTEAAAQSLVAYTASGGRVLAFLPPALEEERVQKSGLEPWLTVLGLKLGQDVVLEGDPELRLPSGIGETFFADTRPHAVTEALARPGSKVQYRLLVSAAQSLASLPGVTPGTLTPLLVTSPAGFSIENPANFTDSARLPTANESSHRGPLTLGFAVEQAVKSSKQSGTSRTVVIGAGNLVWSRAFSDPAWAGNKLLVESAISWLVARPHLVSVPEKAAHPSGLALSEAALSSLFRYVVLSLPISALLLGLAVLFRRKQIEDRSRQSKEAS
ncbi:MAG: GldG family protein [Polyangiaceae bacterium]|nr:GldG family protein [Polyangiaceae bacterium]